MGEQAGSTNEALRMCVGILALMLTIPASGDTSSGRLVLVGATLVDGINSAPVQNSRIVIEDGRFSCVSGPDGCPSSPGDAEHNVSGFWITPGLIDTHAHLEPLTRPQTTGASQRLRFALGVTTVRDAGTEQFDALLEERRRASDSSNPVPRVSISARPSVKYAERYGVDLGEELVRHLVELGADAIKVKDHVRSDLYLEEVRIASDLGVPVWGHTLMTMGPPPASRTESGIAAGLDGIAHLSWVAPFCQMPGVEVSEQPTDIDVHQWAKSYWLTTDSDCLDSLVDTVIAANTWLEPNLVTEWYWWRLPLEPPQNLAFLRTRPPSLRDLLTGRDALATKRPPTFPEPFAKMREFVGRFHAAGGMLIAGTDEVRPGLDLHTEMQLMRRAGLTPFESLQTATRNAAIALGRQDIGTIEIGKLADAVIYTSDPLDPSGTTLDVHTVVKGGIMHNSGQMLEEFRQRYDEMVSLLWKERAQRFAPLLLILLLGSVGVLWLAARYFRPRPQN